MADQLYGRIKRGTGIMQDMSFMRWPHCHAPGGGEEAEDPDMIFEVEWKGIEKDGWWDCTAWGYGVLGTKNGEGYGSGSIFVNGRDGVDLVKRPNGIEHWKLVPPSTTAHK